MIIVNYKQLGKSDVRISPIVVGCWAMGGDYFGEVNDQESIDCIHTYLEHGLHTFDTAEIYGNGRAEEVLGRALKGIDREKYVIISKVFPHHFKMEDMERSCDDSMRRMGVEYMDTYFLHYPPRDGMSIGEAVENINRLKEKGKIQSIGVSNFTKEMLEEARKYGQIDVVQPCYNLLWRYDERDLLPYCKEEGISVIPYSTLAQGLLTGKFKPDTPITGGRSRAALFQPGVYEKCLKVADLLDEIGQHYGRTATQVCINWLLHNDLLTAPIVGGTDKRHAQQNFMSLDFALSKEDYDRIDAFSRDFCSQMPEYVLFFNTAVKGE